MLKYVCKRVIMSALTLFAIVFILFLLMEFLPGSPFNNEKLNETQVALLEAKYGLDQPFFTRFFIYVNNLIHGDFGISYTDVYKRQMV